ncbi:acetate/propionate family kinase [Chitinophaga agrisoli]|uniref:Acetate kinase n=1 Tax=Chitinophaga agrisoli TaxID=2607653 RepID=A0A5B2VPL2_9BACT|nr:acetate/propionate family kinase [Chitinophaga agrisoli]KAA2241693.1 acetate/propionate family kinase [Chitinophaga agrisoli]
MEKTTPVILTVNCGSSSLKFGLFSQTHPPAALLLGQVQHIGKDNSSVQVKDPSGDVLYTHEEQIPDMEAAVKQLMYLLEKRFRQYTVGAIGHRMVQGGLHHMQPEQVTDELLQSLTALMPLAPEHLPAELAAIRALIKQFPQAAQVLCFDTAFHQHLPFPARYYALPRDLWKEGLVRYGFHGLSYEYIMQQLQMIAPETVHGRIIIAHLGNGASMAAVHQGRSIDTTMGLTPAGGLVMSTRAGDMDPGVVLYLLQEKNMDAAALNRLLNKASGLKAISGGETDIQQLLAAGEDTQATEAISYFCYQARKFAGALAAALGGLDTFIFTGGIGEHAAEVRRQICEGLAFLGMHLDAGRNEAQAAVISAAGSPVTIRVIPTNEEQMIAQHTLQWLQDH